MTLLKIVQSLNDYANDTIKKDYYKSFKLTIA